jgi:outer membrane protein OmpA-like peptidoglycan-associated protein
VDVEGGLTGVLTTPQSDQYGLGGTGSVRFRLRMAGPLGLHVALGGSGWSAASGRTATTSLIGGGIGVHFMPRLGPGYLLAEVGIGVGSSGAQWPGESLARLGLVMEAGVGYLFRATPSLDVGPVVRLADAHQLSGSGNTRSDLGFWSLGVTFSFHPAARVAPAPVEAPPPPAPPPAAPPPAPASHVVVDATHITLSERIQFQTDSDVITAESYPVLDELVAALRERPDVVQLTIEGHTDETGEAAHNRALSDQRALSVMRYLVEHGVAAGRLRAQGFGDTRRLVQGNTPEAHAQNRRVEFVITREAETRVEAAVPAPSAPAPAAEEGHAGRHHRGGHRGGGGRHGGGHRRHPH